MPFKKGHKLARGRPKGSLNKRTTDRMKKIEEFIKLLEKGLKIDIKGIKPSERVALWKDLQEFFVPKQQRANQEGDQSININISIDNDDAQL
jgi:hypothetical protein